MKKSALITLAALTIVVPTIASAQQVIVKTNGPNEIKVAQNYGNYNQRDNKVVIVDNDNRGRENVVVVKDDDRRYNNYGNGRENDRNNYGNDRDNNYGNYRDNNYGNNYGSREYYGFGNRDVRWDNYGRHDFYRHGFYREHRNLFIAPRQISWRTGCGWGQIGIRGHHGQVFFENAYMCQQRDGDWVVVNR